MKSIIFITFFTATFIFSTSIYSQKLQTVEFDIDRYNNIDPIILYVTPGDSIQFVTINGDFAIYI
jgi:hypothetical protein